MNLLIVSHVKKNKAAYCFNVKVLRYIFAGHGSLFIIILERCCMVKIRSLIVQLLVIMSLFELHAHDRLPVPYNSIDVLPLDMHGWFADVNRRYLEHFIKTYNPQIIVELGSWLGKSCIFMGKISSATARVYAVDNWTAIDDASIQGDSVAKAKLATLYQQFLSNVIHNELTEKIVPIRMNTLQAAAEFEMAIDLIYVDASHDEQNVYNDIMAWYPKLKIGGIMCGDDYDAKSVQRAVKRANVILQCDLKHEASFWYWVKVK